MDRTPIRTDRIRKIVRGQGFAFVPHRFLYDGFMTTVSSHELCVYFFLILVADRQGMSWYHYDRICSMLSLTLDEYIEARNRLIKKDLIAFDGSRFQVLSLPQELPLVYTHDTHTRKLSRYIQTMFSKGPL